MRQTAAQPSRLSARPTFDLAALHPFESTPDGVEIPRVLVGVVGSFPFLSRLFRLGFRFRLFSFVLQSRSVRCDVCPCRVGWGEEWGTSVVMLSRHSCAPTHPSRRPSVRLHWPASAQSLHSRSASRPSLPHRLSNNRSSAHTTATAAAMSYNGMDNGVSEENNDGKSSRSCSWLRRSLCSSMPAHALCLCLSPVTEVL